MTGSTVNGNSNGNGNGYCNVNSTNSGNTGNGHINAYLGSGIGYAGQKLFGNSKINSSLRKCSSLKNTAISSQPPNN